MRIRQLAAVAGVLGSTAALAATASAEPLHVTFKHRFAGPPTTAQCEAQIGIACYNPGQLQQAYGLKPLYQQGLDGTGKTIVIVDSFGSPTAAADLARFDADNNLPAPPSLKIIQPDGPVPAFDPNDADMVGWAEETSLDVQYSHAIAPGANILLVETPVSETEGVTGFPEIVEAENTVIRHHLGDVITQSFGATEQTFPDARSLLDLRSAYVNAEHHQITVLASSGDDGATGGELDGVDVFPFRTVGWPASDPLVTAVGGTQLHLDGDGNRIAPDNVWNDTALFGSPAAGGGGLSSVFARPRWQSGVRSVVGSARGLPDVSMSSAVDGGVNVFLGFSGSGITPGYFVFGGTSEASPEFAGIVAIADQAAHHDLGLLGPRLYGNGGSGLTDVTAGNNTVTFTNPGPSDPGTFTVDGFDAGPGFDLSSGLGTPDGAATIAALVHPQGHGRH